MFMMGDFNAKCSDWHGNITDTAGHQLQCLLRMFSLSQLVNFPTHHTPAGTGAALDLVITDTPSAFSISDIIAPLGQSDHDIVLVRMEAPSLQHYQAPTFSPAAGTAYERSPSTPDDLIGSSPPRYHFRTITNDQWNCINKQLTSVDWRELLGNTSIDVACKRFSSELSAALAKYQFPASPINRPSSQGRSVDRPARPPWLTTSVLNAVINKRNIYSIYRKFPTAENLARYKAQRNLVKHLSRRDHKRYIQSLQSKLTNSARPSLYSFVRSLSGVSSHHPAPSAITTSADTLTHNPAEMAAALNEHFVRVGTQDDPDWPVPDLSHLLSPASNLSNIVISSEAVIRYIEKLPTGKSPGYDGISNEILKALKLSISYPLIFSNSLSSGVFLSAWKYAVVVPIYKNKGSRHDPGNCRPISLLNTCSKILERIVYDRLYHHLAPLLHDMQSGFRHGDSTSLHLTNLVQRLCTLRDRRHYLGLCFFALAKAFDSVWHRGLLAKLHAYGVTGRLQS